MIFVATGADASANNLGKISLKSVSDIAPSTTTMLNFFAKTWTDDQKIAIDDFLVAFNAATWKTKVKVISMPILIPVQNGVLGTEITPSGSKFRKNIVDFNNEITAIPGLISSTFARIGVNQNGIVLQNDPGTGTITANAALVLDVTTYGITNKSLHYGVYYKHSDKFRSGSASSTQPLLESTLIRDSAQTFNNISVTANTTSSPKEQLLILNGDVTVATSKSYVKNALVATTIVNTNTSAVQVQASIITGGTDNIHNVSTSCFMTFGNYMTDAELLEYGNLINTLMDVLVV